MRPRVQTCLLLLVGVLTTPGSGGTIGRGDDRVYFDNGSGTDPSGAERPANFPFWKPGPGSQRPRNVRTGSPKVGVAGVSSVTLKVSASTPGSLHVETSEPPMEIKPLLDEDVLVAFELSKMKTTQPPPTTVPVAAAAPAQPQGDNGFPSQLAEVLKSILSEYDDGGQSTTQQPRQPPTVDLVPQKPPVASVSNTGEIDQFLPHIEDILKSTLVEHKPEEPQPNGTTHSPPPQTPKVPPTNAGEDLKDILPSLEEAISSILENSGSEVSTTTRRPVLPPVHPTTTDSSRPSQTPKVPPTYAEEDLKEILLTLEEAIGSILKDSEAEASTTTSRPALPPVHPTTTDCSRPLQTPKVPPTDNEEDLRDILPILEEALGSILKDSEAGVPTTTSRTVLPSASAMTTDGRRPPQTPKLPPADSEDNLKDILPALEEALGSILKNGDAEVLTTTSRTVPPPVRPLTSDDEQHFGAVQPKLEGAIRSILEEAALEQEATARQHTSPQPPSQNSPPKTKVYGSRNYLPVLKQAFKKILHNHKSGHSGTFPNTNDQLKIAKTPILPVTAPTEKQPYFQNNLIVS